MLEKSFLNLDDTIASISTAWGEAGIAIVRLSGPQALDIAEKTFRGIKPLKDTPPRYMRNGFLLDERGAPIDEVLGVWFRAPKSYTGEDVVEIHCHGGLLVASKCLELLTAQGARLAEPGEFTQRAFLNGRIDLTQAEAVLGVIRAKSDEALLSAARTLRGELSARVNGIYDSLLNISATLEANLDFPEEDIPYLSQDDLFQSLKAIALNLQDVIYRCKVGKALRDGIKVAIVGRPNVGKSSIFNALLEETRAIVTPIPGTTRDIIEGSIVHRGIPIIFMDTAGLRATDDLVETIGVSMAQKALREADLRLWIIDGSEQLTKEEIDMAMELKNHSHIVAINKADIPQVISLEDVKQMLPESEIMVLSSYDKEAIGELKERIVKKLFKDSAINEGFNATARQIETLKSVLSCVENSISSLASGEPQDLVASNLLEARYYIDRLLGRNFDEDLIHLIFSQFCVGK
ncbi:tRNA uridine-5-carboxymethylaminomethyl(34) synthesis GTPase MnmE [Acetomicrobium sp.]|uniref:tRNA uridine-5-carboxymethylaminomethyl(34) synthesis GTPase MnmE n=1 Tax=Acetomicrobium sp. TaxID=1872099 RepID=UPI001BCACDD3